MRNVNQFKGCLIGGAVGDALGYAVEFLSASDIFRRYGENGISEYELHRGIAEISDDTQMTLFTATGLLVGTTREMTRGIRGDYAECYIADSYRDWYRTQTEKYPLPEEFHYSWRKYSRNVQSQGARKHLPGSFNPWSEWDFGGAFKSQQRLRRNYARCADWIVFLRQEI